MAATSSNLSGDAARGKKASGGARWERAGRVDDVKDQGPHTLSAGGVALVALRSPATGKLKVFEGRCPHQGALLGEGEIEGNSLVCRNHRWKFDCESGERIGGRHCLKECPTETRGEEIWVDIAPLAPTETETVSTQAALRTLEDLPGPRKLPFLGNTMQIDMNRLHLQVEEWANVYGRLYTMKLGPRSVLVVNDAKVAEIFFRERPETYRRVSEVESVFTEMTAVGVFAAEGDAWRAQRRLAMEALANKNLRGFYPTLEVVAARLVRRWERAADEGRVLDIADELKRFTVDVTTQLVFGHDMNTLEKGDEDIIQRHLEQIFPAFNRRLNALFPYWRYIRLPQDRKLEHAIKSLREWIAALVADARKKVLAGKTPANFLEAMLLARDLDGQPFPDEVIFGNALTMLLAGEDTTAYTLAWSVHHLCEDRRATDALRSELDSVLANNPNPWPKDIDQAGKLVYTNGVANESMRLRAVAPTIFHEPLRDVVVEDILIPKGTMIITLSRLPTLDEKAFREPKTFMPERWLPGWEGPHEASAHVPFGSGPRICPGRSLAILEMRVVLSALYKNFIVERVGKPEDTREVTSFTMMPKGLLVVLRRRP